MLLYCAVNIFYNDVKGTVEGQLKIPNDYFGWHRGGRFQMQLLGQHVTIVGYNELNNDLIAKTY